MAKTPYPHQRRSVDAIYRYYEEGGTGHILLVLPTSAGKSFIAALFCTEVLQQWPDQRIIVLAHRKELLSQNYLELMEYWPQAPAGLYSAGLHRRENDARILFAGIQSIWKKAMHVGWADILIVDEAHLISNESAGMYRRFIQDMARINPAVKVVGMTATPGRTKTGLLTEGEGKLFDDIAYEVGILELLEAGLICPVVTKATQTQIDTSGVHIRGGEFVAKELDAAVDDTITEKVLDEVMVKAADRKSWLVFCPSVSRAGYIRDALRERGVAAEAVTEKTPPRERDRIVERFRNGQIQAVTNVDVLTVGFSVRRVDTLICLRPTRSPSLWVQMVGRGMRLSPETQKRECLLLDFSGNTIRFGCIDRIRFLPKEKGGFEAAPTKECPECGSLIPLAAKECPDCGWLFPAAQEEKPKYAPRASVAPILSTQQPEPEPEHAAPESHHITDVRYCRHEKPDKPPSLRVDYYAGFRRVASEWVCLEHSGPVRVRARQWWMRRGRPPVPRNVDEALDRVEELARPLRIVTKQGRGGFMEIVEYEWPKEEKRAKWDMELVLTTPAPAKAGGGGND